MDPTSKAVCDLLPADVNGEHVLVVCSDAHESGRNLLVALKQGVKSLTYCATATDGLPSNQSEFLVPVTKDNLATDQYRGRFCAVILFNPMSDDIALDILNNLSLSLLTDGNYIVCIQDCDEHSSYERDSVQRIEKCLKEVRQKGTEFCWRFVSAKIINATKTFYCTVHTKASLDSRNFIGTESFQEVLNNQVYSIDVSKMYELLYGKNDFISSGAHVTVEPVLPKLKLQPGSRILDVGSGIGGNSFLLAKRYDAEVYGTDICMDLVDKATRRSKEMPELKVDFEVCDISLRKFPEASFDAIFSKDVILHIEDKESLYKRFSAWLKPGGKILVADFTRCEAELSDDFKSYLQFRKNTWYLLTLKEYEQIVKGAGFVNVTAEDVSYLQTNAIDNEFEQVKSNQQKWTKEYGEEFYNRFHAKLETKRRITQSGDHSWGLFYGEKAE